MNHHQQQHIVVLAPSADTNTNINSTTNNNNNNFNVKVKTTPKTNKRSSPLKSKQTIKKLTTISAISAQKSNETTKSSITSNSSSSSDEPSHPKGLKKAAQLPPSPPSSFGSDSDSDHSSSSSNATTHHRTNVIYHTKAGINNTSTTNKLTASHHGHAVLKAAGKQNSSVKQLQHLRHQPYTLKSTQVAAVSSLGIKLSKSALQGENGPVYSSSQSAIKEERDNSCEDDDCWPFLCSLSVRLILLIYVVLVVDKWS